METKLLTDDQLINSVGGTNFAKNGFHYFECASPQIIARLDLNSGLARFQLASYKLELSISIVASGAGVVLQPSHQLEIRSTPSGSDNPKVVIPILNEGWPPVEA